MRALPPILPLASIAAALALPLLAGCATAPSATSPSTSATTATTATAERSDPGAEAAVPARAAAFVERQVTVRGVARTYQVFVPSSAAGGAMPPVVLFLHGSGERGSDGAKQATAGLGNAIRARMDAFPAIVVFPQVPGEDEWSDHFDLAVAALDAATAEFDGDRDRTYATGMSMGGYGTWEIALRNPGRFAALVPVCGGVTSPNPAKRPSLRVTAVDGAPDPFAAVAEGLRDTPAWIAHGAKDDVVLPEQSRKMVAALQAAGARSVHYQEYPDANHNSWDAAYADPAMWTWLWRQRR